MYMFDESTDELFLYDIIGPADFGMIDSGAVIADLKRAGGRDITVRINSPGGDVIEGRAIYNALRQYPGSVSVSIDSAAYSIAGYIAMAGQSVAIAKNAMLMLHNPYTVAIGNAEELRKAAGVLDKYTDTVLAAYADKSGKSADEVRAILDAETYYTASEAVDEGFADEITGEVLAADERHPIAAMMDKRSGVAAVEPGSRWKGPSRPMKVQKVFARG